MADIYTRMQATASRLLTKYAQGAVILLRPGTPTPAANSWDAPTVTDPTKWTLDATVKGVSAKYVNNVTILAGDLEVTAAIFGDTPQAGDLLSIDGKPATIIQIMPVPAAGLTVAWKFIVRA